MIREATPEDIPRLLQWIRDLAIFEKLEPEMQCTESDLHHQLFVLKRSFALLLYDQETPVGFAIWFYNFSTFTGRNGLYLEDLYIEPAYRGRGHGQEMMLFLIEKAKALGCGRMEWSVLDWNESAIRFYKQLGAVPMDDWTVYRLRFN